MESFIFPKNYDIVLAFASLIHSDYEATEKLFAKIHKNLNEGGIFYVSMKKSHTYTEVEKDNGFGIRKYYHYSVDDYKNIA